MKASAYLSIFDDWEILEPAIASIDPYVDEIVVVDGAYSWLAKFFAQTGRDAGRSLPQVYDVLQKFGPKVRYVNGIWDNELHKRMAGYSACQHRYIYRVDADEILFVNDARLRDFQDSDYPVGEMEMPIYVSPGVIRGRQGASTIERQALLFDSSKMSARDHLNYLWLILPTDEAAQRQGPDAQLVYPDPIAFNAHLTHWRPPTTAINRARFYVLNYARGGGNLPWLSAYMGHEGETFDQLFAKMDPQILDDILMGHEIVAEPPDLFGYTLENTPLFPEQEEKFLYLYDDFLDGLAASNASLSTHQRYLASGTRYSIDLSSERAIAPFITGGKFSLTFANSIANATATILTVDRSNSTQTLKELTLNIHENSFNFDFPGQNSVLRRTLRFIIWNSDASSFNSFGASP